MTDSAKPSTPTLQQFLDFMSRNRMNITSQRCRIAEAFFSYPGHHTLEDFYQHMQTLDPSIGQTTVYRTLKLLCAAGLATEVHFTDTVAHYEIVNAGVHHDHLMCVHCGKIVEIYDQAIEKLQKAIVRKHDFTLLGHYHVLYGLCRDCRDAQAREAAEQGVLPDERTPRPRGGPPGPPGRPASGRKLRARRLRFFSRDLMTDHAPSPGGIRLFCLEEAGEPDLFPDLRRARLSEAGRDLLADLAGRTAAELAQDAPRAFFCSDSPSALACADLLRRAFRPGGGRMPILADPGFRERDWGAWAGLRQADVEKRYPGALAGLEAEPMDYAPAGGESLAMVRRRALLALVRARLHSPEGRLAVLGDRAFLRCVLADWLALPPRAAEALSLPFGAHFDLAGR